MKKLLYFLFLILIISSCSASRKMVLNVKDVRLGMTKEQVTSMMGDRYKIVAVQNTPDGHLEVLEYGFNLYENYLLYFLDDKLDSLEKTLKEQPCYDDDCHCHGRGSDNKKRYDNSTSNTRVDRNEAD